jgi:hypothetical protein
MKPIKFITTFSKNGYDVYGKTWLETFSKNVLDKNITVDLYVDFNIDLDDDRVKLIDYDLAIPNHKQWLKNFEESYDGGSFYNKKMSMRFSYKAFVMQHALLNNNDNYLIWLDGDCIFKPEQDFSTFPENLLTDKFIAVQREDNGGNDHCESGIVIFDACHKDKNKFLLSFTNNYKLENVIHESQPYDGFIIYKSLNNIEYMDLNNGYGRSGIQSDPSETFLHPEINKRFYHNIGLTGKKQYESYDSVANRDEYFKLLSQRDKRSPEEIKTIREKLLQIRRNNK